MRRAHAGDGTVCGCGGAWWGEDCFWEGGAVSADSGEVDVECFVCLVSDNSGQRQSCLEYLVGRAYFSLSTSEEQIAGKILFAPSSSEKMSDVAARACSAAFRL